MLSKGLGSMIQHKHLLINALVKRPIKQTHEAEKFLQNLVITIDMKPLIRPVVRYVETEGNRGMTGAILIETSHIAFHIWDEQEPAKLRFDLYTCGELNDELVQAYVDRQFGIISGHWMLYDREDLMVLLDEGTYQTK
jgi:S-adenosylmethionine/arginine decarboxylase-like enzyme